LTLRFSATFHASEGHRRAFHEHTRWTVTPIAGSTLSWDSSWPGESSVGRGIAPVATFRGLPASNDEFGLKTVQLYWRMESGTDWPQWQGASAPYEVFFDKLAANHPPDGDHWVRNWFYYWSQFTWPSILSAQTSSCDVVCASRTPAMQYGEFLRDQHAFFSMGDCHFTVGPTVAVLDRVPEVPGQDLYGIDHFVHAIVHESQHFVWACDWWSNDRWVWGIHKSGEQPLDDKDEDGLPNVVEWDSGGVYDWEEYRTPTCPWPGPVVPNDQEWKNYRDHRDVTGSAYYTRDWAYPGHNSRAVW
jgi:hypothetical protein